MCAHGRTQLNPQKNVYGRGCREIAGASYKMLPFCLVTLDGVWGRRRAIGVFLGGRSRPHIIPIQRMNKGLVSRRPKSSLLFFLLLLRQSTYNQTTSNNVNSILLQKL